MATKDNRFRIIAGHWRGQKLAFPDVDGLRPTPDRVRETLFNWLAPTIDDAHCLDLFAGSGALGIEALSRGASKVTFVENNSTAATVIMENLHQLTQEQTYVIRRDVIEFLSGPSERYNIVFLDPPYHGNLINKCCYLLEMHSWLHPGAHIYLETEVGMALDGLPEGWSVLKTKRAGQVSYHLAVNH